MAETKTTATQVGRDTADRLRESMATNDFARKAKDAAYTLVGLGVMGAQRASAATRGAAKQLGVDDTSVGSLDLRTLRFKSEDARVIARRQLNKADDVLGGALARIEEAFAPLEDKLPEPAKDTVSKFREAGKGLHAHVRTRLGAEDVVAPPAKSTAKKTPGAPKE